MQRASSVTTAPIFPDPAMTVAAIDRLVHHATIFELNVESYRRRTALSRPRPGPTPQREREPVATATPEMAT
jgi:hypothetical protein